MKKILFSIQLIIFLFSNLCFAQFNFEFDTMKYGRYDFGFVNYQDKFYCVGGFDNKGKAGEDLAARFIEVYDIKNNKWSVIKKLSNFQRAFDSELIDGKMYMFGDYSNQNLSQVYDIEKNRVDKISNVPIKHYWSTTESYNNKVYVIGGYDKQDYSFLNIIQIYNPENGVWTFKKIPINSRKSRFLHSVKWNNYFFIWDYKIMFRYNPENDLWQEIESAKPYINGFQEAITYKDKILFFGGSKSAKGSETSKNIVIFDPYTNSWEIQKDIIKIKRHYRYGVTIYNDAIYIVGGRESNSWVALNQIEKILISDITKLQIKKERDSVDTEIDTIEEKEAPIIYNQEDEMLIAYPNPLSLSSNLNLRYKFESNKEYELSIIDNHSYRILKKIKLKPIGNSISLNSFDLFNSSGVYILNLFLNKKKLSSVRIIVLRL